MWILQTITMTIGTIDHYNNYYIYNYYRLSKNKIIMLTITVNGIATYKTSQKISCSDVKFSWVNFFEHQKCREICSF